jgi:hypothetical protein
MSNGSDTSARRPHRTTVALVGATLAACVVLAGCGTSPSVPTTTKPPATTTTTLTPAQLAVLQPKLLTVDQFPTGWTLDTAPGAASTKGTPACVAAVAAARGSATRANAVFLGPKSVPAAAIQTVASFAPGQAKKSAKALRTEFLSCNGGTLQQSGQSIRVSVGTISIGPTGDAGFAAEMALSAGSQKAYLYVFFAVKGDYATFLGWRTDTPSTTLFAQMAAKALAKL